MGYSYCCVRGCENNSRKNISQPIAFHAFPSNPELKSKWLKAIGRPDWKPLKSMRLCSAHFSENNIHYNKNRIRLKEDAYPVYLLPWDSNFDASHVKACRVCLATDLKMFSIQDKDITRCMDSIIELKANLRTDGLPPYVCYICAAHLRKCYNFLNRCRSAQTILRDIFKQHGQVKYEDEGDVHVKSSEARVDVKIIVEHDNTDDDYLDDIGQSSPRLESQEDVKSSDVPEEMDKQTEASKPKKKDHLSRPKTKKISKKALLAEDLKNLKEYFNIVELSEEEQLSEWLNNRCHATSLPTIAKCDVCFKQFAHEDCYKTHLPKHEPSRGKAVCPICKERFKNHVLVRTHVKSAHSKKYTCKLCPKVRYNRRTAKTHFLRHTGAKFRCKREGCGFEAGTAAAVYTHARTAHARGTHACTACGRSCLTPQALGLHVHAAHPDLKDAEGSPDSRCNECDLNFVSEAARRVHLLSFCPHTNKSDPSDTTKEDAFENTCTQCGEACASAAELTSHVRTKHRYLKPIQRGPNDSYPTPCEYCEVSLGSRREHFLHVSRKHPSKRHAYRTVVNAVCHLCGKGLQSVALLKSHVLRHAAPAVRCEQCGRMFYEKWQLVKHARVRHAGPAGPPRHACAQCGLTFADRTNLHRHSTRVHSEDTPYDCPMCDKKFKYSTSKNLHIRTVHHKEPHPPRKKRTKARSSRQKEIEN